MHRVLFEKTGTAVWMSHLDLMRLMQRAFRRAGVLLHHSQGYTPHPYVSMLLPLSVGMESVCEIMEYELDTDETIAPDALYQVLPAGVRVREVYESSRKARELALMRVQITLEYDGGVPDGAEAALAALFARDEILVEKRSKKGGMADVDLKPLLRSLTIRKMSAQELTLDVVASAQNPGMNPQLLVAAIARHLPALRPDFARIRRVEIFDEQMEVFR